MTLRKHLICRKNGFCLLSRYLSKIVHPPGFVDCKKRRGMQLGYVKLMIPNRHTVGFYWDRRVMWNCGSFLATLLQRENDKGSTVVLVSQNNAFKLPTDSPCLMVCNMQTYETRRRMARERRGAGWTLVSMETQF